MKIMYGNNNCAFIFEENDKFAGKEVCIYGELCIDRKDNTKALLVDKNVKVMWVVPCDGSDVKNGVRLLPVEEDIKEELLTYIGIEAKKQGVLLGYFEEK